MPNIRMLIVTDGVRFSFGPNDTVHEAFTLHTMIAALTNSTDAAITVDTAHRRSDPHATFQNFNFHDTIPDLSVYDEIWMIADEGNNAGTAGPTDAAISEPEKFALATFMDGGGGVFAVGDHDAIGSLMCGQLPRVRSMRKWFDAATLPAGYPLDQVNHPSVGANRGDTLQPAPDGHYYFDLQSDETPQTITHLGAPHPILQSPGGPIVKFPDHMHEGEAIAAWPGYDFGQSVTFLGVSFPEYPQVGPTPEHPRVIAQGHVIAGHTVDLEADYPYHSGADTFVSAAQDIGTLSVYDGLAVGLGRVVTGSTFHHYMDLNLIGDPEGSLESGANTRGGLPPAVLDGIKTFYVNMAIWLARPVRRALTFIVDKSTFGQDEVASLPAATFTQAIFVVVDGLKRSLFPNAGMGALSQWAPVIPPPPGTNITFAPTAMSSELDPLSPLFQRFTFTYSVRFPDASAFGFPSPPDSKLLTLAASLAVTPVPLAALAQIELIKAADPYSLDLADGNGTSWLSSDVRVFSVIEGNTLFGRPALGGTPAAARAFIQDLAAHITPDQFRSLPHDEDTSALSILERTLPLPPTFTTKAIYNFALARVRLNGTAAVAHTARVFFRLFQSQTAAALTYEVDGSGNPVNSFRQTTGAPDATKIALLGLSGDGSEYVSVPCFAEPRVANTTFATNMTTQPDPTNVKTLTPVAGTEVDTFYGAWLDTNQPGAAFLPPHPQANTDGPFTGTLQPLMTAITTGVHQCIVAEIVYDEAPIAPNSNPSTSDKLAQRNIAFTVIPNPGAADSRVAAHTFEIRPTPPALFALGRPDELMIDWRDVPKGSVASIYLPAVTAAEVLDLASAMYATHELTASDAHTLQCPAGGVTYIPIPQGAGANFAGLFSLEMPAGVKKGERYDVIVRQLTTTGAQIGRPAPVLTPTTGSRTAVAKKARTSSALVWRRVAGAFQIAIPVSVRAAMLVDEQRTLSVMRWIGQSMSRNSRWYRVFQRYLGVLAGRVEGLGGDPSTVPATPTGTWPSLVKGLTGKTPGDPDEHREHEHDEHHEHREHREHDEHREHHEHDQHREHGGHHERGEHERGEHGRGEHRGEEGDSD